MAKKMSKKKENIIASNKNLEEKINKSLKKNNVVEEAMEEVSFLDNFTPENVRTNEVDDKHLLTTVRDFILSQVDDSRFSSEKEMRDFIMEEARKQLANSTENSSSEQKARILEILKDEIFGYGPITSLLEDDEVSEIMVNGPDDIYIERAGKIKKVSNVFFTDDEHVKRTIERIVNPIGRTIDASNPMVDARLPDGSRVNAVIPPLALNGPTITIRKFMKSKLTAHELIQFGSITEDMMRYLAACVMAKQNILLSGGTGSGKTTFLNLLSSYIGNEERIITIEDAAELQLQQEHVVSLETKTSAVEGAKEYGVRDLVKNSLRMRPDRILVGEVRGAEVIDMLQAMNTGHDGSMTTGHANSAEDMLFRMETMVLMSGIEIPLPAIRQQIVRAIDVIAHTSRISDGTRKITEISEVLGVDENGKYIVNKLFEFTKTGVEDGFVKGDFVATGNMPTNLDEIEQHNLILDTSIFKKGYKTK